jgi:hypothetical protein
MAYVRGYMSLGPVARGCYEGPACGLSILGVL